MKLTPTLTVKAQDHAIKSVTIFKSSKAEIVRVFSLNLNVSSVVIVDSQSDVVRSHRLARTKLRSRVCRAPLIPTLSVFLG